MVCNVACEFQPVTTTFQIRYCAMVSFAHDAVLWRDTCQLHPVGYFHYFTAVVELPSCIARVLLKGKRTLSWVILINLENDGRVTRNHNKVSETFFDLKILLSHELSTASLQSSTGISISLSQSKTIDWQLKAHVIIKFYDQRTFQKL